MKSQLTILAFFSMFLFQSQIIAQQFNEITRFMFVELETKDGMNLLGTVQINDGNIIVLSHETYGTVEIQTQWIKSIKQIQEKSLKEDGYWHENKNYSRNYYGPTGMGLEKGKGYYQNVMLVWNHIAYGFTDYFTFGIDFEIFSILLRLSGDNIYDADNNPLPALALTPKFSYSFNEKVHAGLGSIFLFIPGNDHYLDGAISYAVGTYGDKNNSATIGFGLPSFKGEFRPDSPILTLSSQYRLSPRFSLLTENWFLFINDKGEDEFDDSNDVYIGIHGFRYLARELTWDFGIATFAVFSEESLFFPIPYISVVFPFDRLKNRTLER